MSASNLVPIATRRVQSVDVGLNASKNEGSQEGKISIATHQALKKNRKVNSESMLPRMVPLSQKEGLALDSSMIPAIRDAAKSLLSPYFVPVNHRSDGIKVFCANHRHIVFKTEKIEGYVFKLYLGLDSSPEQRFENHKLVSRMVRKHHKQHLLVPKAMMLHLPLINKVYTIIAEEELLIEHGRHYQQLAYEEAGEELDPALEEVTWLICRSKLRDIKWENIPVLKRDREDEPYRIGLVDLEDLRGAEDGLLGVPYEGIVGLVKCVSEKQGEKVIKIAKQHLNWDEKLEELAAEALNERKKILVQERKIKQFYEQAGYQDPEALIPHQSNDSDEMRRVIEHVNFLIKENNKWFWTTPAILRRQVTVVAERIQDISYERLNVLLLSLKVQKRIYSYTEQPQTSFKIQA